MSSKDQQIEDLERELVLTSVDFLTQLKKLEQKILALTDGHYIIVKTQFAKPVYKPAEVLSPF